MATYEITYVPNSASDRLGLDTRVDAEGHRVAGRFAVFVDGSGETVLQISAAHVLQIKTLAG